MFERYNGHARCVVFFARFAASQSGSAAIESEHLLLGLIREASPMFSRLTPSLSLEELRAKIPRKIVVENPQMRIHMPLSAECKRILSYSAEEANDLDHRCIGPEHLLLAILRENTCLAARVLAEMDVQLESVRQKVTLESPQGTESRPGEESTVVVGRDIVHALVDRLPEQMLPHVKEMIDRMVSRSRREHIRDDDATVVKGTFSTSRPESTEGTGD
ncbi:MAG TPA: Clp protease N-terminal domain-containing protein [Terriglobia bacterium]|nr:Clp protease N-terminal domain-containing protein [Terriglobia bacterium]